MTAVTQWLSTGWRLQVTRALALLAVIAITVYVYSIRDRTEDLARYGYPGIFLLSVLTYATVILPAPGLAVIFALAGTGAFSPVGVALAAGAGATLGELTGYLAGFGGQAVVEHRQVYERMTAWVQRRGMLAVFLLAAIPNPVFDVAGIVAGVLRMPVHKFALAALAGQFIKMLVFAYAGVHSFSWVMGLLPG